MSKKNWLEYILNGIFAISFESNSFSDIILPVFFGFCLAIFCGHRFLVKFIYNNVIMFTSGAFWWCINVICTQLLFAQNHQFHLISVHWTEINANNFLMKSMWFFFNSFSSSNQRFNALEWCLLIKEIEITMGDPVWY